MSIISNCGGWSLNRGKSYQKLLIKPYDGGEPTEFNLSEIPVCDSITFEDGYHFDLEIAKLGDFSMFFPMKPLDSDSMSLFKTLAEFQEITIRLEVECKKLRAAILRYPHRKRRKTTYKTLRHDCAKRNGRR